MVGAGAPQVPGGGVFGWEEPHAIWNILLVFEKAFAKLWVNWNITEDLFLFFETWNTECIFNATIGGEDIFLLDGYDLAYSQSGV